MGAGCGSLCGDGLGAPNIFENPSWNRHWRKAGLTLRMGALWWRLPKAVRAVKPSDKSFRNLASKSTKKRRRNRLPAQPPCPLPNVAAVECVEPNLMRPGGLTLNSRPKCFSRFTMSRSRISKLNSASPNRNSSSQRKQAAIDRLRQSMHGISSLVSPGAGPSQFGFDLVVGPACQPVTTACQR